MRKAALWIMLVLMAFSPLTGCSNDKDAGADERWSLVWSDEFDGDQIDEAKWTYDIGNGFTTKDGAYVAGWGNSELEYYTDREDNARVEAGKLKITAQKEAYEGLHYTSARLKTKGLFAKQYGRFEIKAKLPAGQGLWPALWMLPEDETYGGWAASGEIDIMEAKGSIPSEVSGAIHYGGNWPNNTYSTASYTFPDGKTIEDGHVYSLEWEPGEIRWYVDGVRYQTQNEWYSITAGEKENQPFPAPFNQPFHLIMNLAVGGHFDGNPTDETKFPAVMEIDYVRVYELTGSDKPTS